MTMDHSTIENILKADYNRETWKGFLRNLFPFSTFWSSPQSLDDLTSPYVASALRIGDVKLDESGIERSIGLFEVVLDEKVILERNRVGLRNLLRKYWKDMDGAFIVYTQPSSGLWRFTYVSELTGFDASGDFREIKTDPKRYTYVFGDGESCRTAVERFQTLLTKGKKATIADVIDAFSVEKLSKSFFDGYKKQYELFCEYLTAKPGIFKVSFNGDEKAVRDFVKLFLGRITFLYFIQKKGWLGVPLNGNWGDGDKHFLWSVFQSHKHKSLFYREVLTKLFFDTLNTPRESDLIELPDGKKVKIPFLNGGLFEEENPNYRNIVFKEDLFEDLFNFFNQYNFTIYEDDPNDHTVAVDPEMLGHIFENLLEDNKDKGAFYTPKEIVHYMSQESLIEYLTTWFENKGYEVVGHASFKDTNETLFVNPNDYNHGQLELETPVYNEENKIDRSVIEKLLKKSLDDSDRSLISQYIDEFNKALDSVKICDPAIGSGAFPMGLLQEIFAAKQTLWHFKYGNLDEFPASEIKLNIIQNSIYGVDIEKGAVDIARLRFWLSLVVDESEPKPLPNLDYKIVVGNSLVSKLDDVVIDIDWEIDHSTPEFEASKLYDRKMEQLKKLTEVQGKFFRAGSSKKSLEKMIRDIKIEILVTQLELMWEVKRFDGKPYGKGKQLKEQIRRQRQTLDWKNALQKLALLKNNSDLPLNFFDWKLNFPEVLDPAIGSNIGFDIIIANPPYMKERDNAHIFEEINTSSFGKRYHQGKMDYWYYFLHLAINISKKFSIISFITSRYWINSSGSSKLIERIHKELNFASVVDIGKLKVFDKVAGHHMIHTYTTSKRKHFRYKKVFNTIKAIEDEISGHDCKISILSNENIYKGSEIIFEESPLITSFRNCIGDKYQLSQGVIEASDKISTKMFKKYGSPNVEIGAGIFVLSETELKDLNLNRLESDLIVDYLDPSDIKKYQINRTSRKYLIYSDNFTKNLIESDENYKRIKAHLDLFADYITSSNRPYGLHRPRDIKFFKNRKIIFKGMFVNNEFAIDDLQYFFGMNCLSIIENDPSTGFSLEFLLGILNSKFALRWFNTYGKRRGAGVDIGVDKLKTFPLPPNSSSKVEILVNKIIKCSEDKQRNDLINQLEILIYRLYDLPFEEARKINNALEISEKEYTLIEI